MRAQHNTHARHTVKHLFKFISGNLLRSCCQHQEKEFNKWRKMERGYLSKSQLQFVEILISIEEIMIVIVIESFQVKKKTYRICPLGFD